jgi:hypothetical protein
MKVKDIIDLLENTLGRQSEGYMFNLIDEALKDISSKRKNHNVKIDKQDLIKDKRWYDIPSDVIDIHRIEILNSEDDYIMIPNLTNPHSLRKEDEY